MRKVQLITNDLEVKDITWTYKILLYVGSFWFLMSIVLGLVFLYEKNQNGADVVLKVQDRIVTQKEYIILTSKDLKTITKVKGYTLAKFCHNPGAIMVGNPEIDVMAIAQVSAPQGNFLFFPNEEIGFKALKKLLITEYANMTVVQAIKKYCPNSHSILNNETRYVQNLCRELKCFPSTKIKHIDLDKLSKAIAKEEGFY